MLELLLGHDPGLLAAGTLEMHLGIESFAIAAAFIALAVALLMGLRRPLGRAGIGARVALWAMRSALLVLLFFLLLDPQVQLLEQRAIQGHVAVVLDDSLSMTIRDDGKRSRAEDLLDRFAPGEGDVAKALEARFDVRYLRFAQSLESLSDVQELSFTGSRSRLDRVLTSLAERSQGGTLASVVIASDGGGLAESARIGVHGDANASSLQASTKALAARGVAVHTVGFGAPRFNLDVELADVVLPTHVLRGDSVNAQVSIEHRGKVGPTLRMQVERDAVVVAQLPINLSKTHSRTAVRIPLTFMDAGARRVVFRLQSLDGEVLGQNNTVTRVVQVRGEAITVLHMEGEPRFEVKFLRRAVADDDGIQLRSLVRTAENKFYRLGVDDASELPDGLPSTDAALFRYDAVVIGSLGNDLLDAKQQQRLQEFVARRGGGLVMLGGRNAFAEGGFGLGPLAALSPVVVPTAARSYRRWVRIEPAVAPGSDPLLQIAAADELTEAWSRLPPLTMVNPIRRTKPGASLLLRGDDGTDEPVVGLAWHRYGRGTVAAFPVRDSWRWQMHADIPLQDLSHERLWRGLLRHVARPAGKPLRFALSNNVAASGDTVFVEAEALNASYRPRSDASLSLSITHPSGQVRRMPLSRNNVGAGGYHGSFGVDAPGRYELVLVDETQGADGQRVRAGLEVNAVGEEFHRAELDVAGLTRIAQSTGGRFLMANDAMDLLQAIDDKQGSRQVERRISLRHVPALLLLMVLLACGEWLLRRRCELP